MTRYRLLVLVIAFVLGSTAVPLPGQFPQRPVTPEQRRELAEINKQIGESSNLLRRKQIDEAEQAVNAAEERLESLLAQNDQLENDRLVATIRRNIGLRRRAIGLARGEKPENLGVSFSDDVAPIINDHCLGCHGASNPRGGLRLDTFAGWKQGGASGQPLARVLLPRLTAPNPQQRMPRGQDPLSPNQIQTIARWIQEGTRFDGAGDDAPIGEKPRKKSDDEPITIARSDGSETVSFVNDVAPFMVNICGQCHMGNNPRADFDITTFEGLIRGGESGRVIEPGDPEGSRLWLMVSNREQPRMPPGQLLITRRNYNALTTWIREGAKFDGDDPQKPLRDLVPSEESRRSAELAKLAPAQFVAHRRERSEAHWNRAFPKESPVQTENAEFLLYGNVEEGRLRQAAGWANEQVTTLRSTFASKESPLWKGKLAIFLIKDRFGYEEFALAVNERSQVPPEVRGHLVLTPDFEDAYLVLEDVGDQPSPENPGLKAHLQNYVTQAYLARHGGRLPDWAVQGSGLHLAAKAAPTNPYFTALRTRVGDALQGLDRPDQVFADGTFSPADTPAVSFALIDYLVQAGGPARYQQLIGQLAQNGDPAAAIQTVYRTAPLALATAFVQHAATRRR